MPPVTASYHGISQVVELQDSAGLSCVIIHVIIDSLDQRFPGNNLLP